MIFRSRSLLTLVTVALPAIAAFGAAKHEVKFNRDIRPIMSDTCFHCHGPDAKARKANLRLDLRDEALKPAKSGEIPIVPGKPEKSEIIKRIFTKDTDDLMPPPDAHKTFTPAQKDLFKRWVAQGAKYEAHWSYTPLVKPSVPAGANGVDFLVQQRLKEIKLRPSPEAGRRTLARRLAFDLTGLPPRPEDVDAFVADKSTDACAKLVEQLLASPHYGERMAIGWLDVVRYADTIGYHSDTPRNVWPYRDYVIRAFNDNKPFDQFTREQLAGDLIPNSGQEQKVGSAFNRLLLTTEEGGAQAKDYEARYLTDRVRAVGSVWLGQTIGCTQCHDHKFDPITSRDFYSMGAFFADLKEGIIGRREDGMLVLSADDQKKLGGIETRLAASQKEFNAPHPELADAQSKWEAAAAEAVASEGQWTVLKPAKAVSEKKSIALTTDKDGLVSAKLNEKLNARGQNDGTAVYRITVNVPLKGVTGFRLQALKEKDASVGLAANGNFVLSEISLTAGKEPVKLANASATFEQSGYPAEAAIDGIADKKENGWAVLGATGADQALYLEAEEELNADAKTPLTFVLKFAWGENHEMRNLRLSATTAPKPVRAPAATVPAKDIADILKVEPAKRTAAQRTKLEQQFKQIAPQLADLRAKIASAEKEKKDFETAAPKCIVSVRAETNRTVRILPRGNWMDDSGPVMQAALPAFLPKPARTSTNAPTRLDLAEWIVWRENPLTARVFVNRVWKQFFGTGLSKMLDDLGAQGEPPANPALLDWLAADFRDSGWDVKRLVRTIVNSQTYRQVSTATKELAARDPYNRELARQSRWRLDAELVRDNALAVSGLLVAKIGGPSVKPYQPDGYWENLNFPVRAYDASKGEDQYRRGLYTWWQRSFLHPSMVAFDAPSREECAADRNRSNIPQQALVLLNDPSYVEAARAFATRIVREGGQDADARITWAWRQALARAPRADELKTIRALLDKHLAEYAKDAKAAEALLKVGLSAPPTDLNQTELAAWTSVARVIINLHETITRS
ncbi:MAG: PSD1 domain-containing protein [Verrucomicrobia bacterium]|nr:PSD1 domain-containing protein [Verrucomicrobiota bacterium]